MKTMMWAYSQGSEGAKLVADAMGIKRIKHENSEYKGGPGSVVINWGSGAIPGFVRDRAGTVIMSDAAVCRGINKRRFFDIASEAGVNVPEYTSGEYFPKKWLREGHVVLARLALESSRGNGIVVMKKLDDFVYAPMYTKYIDKENEYRVHVVNGKVIYVQKKVATAEAKEGYVRNYDNGYILLHANSNAGTPMAVKTQAIAAVKAVGADYSGVDVIERDGVAYVLEVNAAPYQTEGTAAAYAKAFYEMIG